MRTIYAEYNINHDSIDVYTSAGYMLRIDCIFRKNRALAPHERSAVPLGTDHCPVC